LFARWLGFDRYGTFASLLSAFLILTVPGSALQAAVARDVSRDPGGSAEALARQALRAVLLLALPVGAVVALLREPLASLLGVDLRWGAAAAVWFSWLWIALSLQRGLFQGYGRYGSIGVSLIVEAFGRLLFGAALLAAGLGATGALLGTGFAIACSYAVLVRVDAAPGHRGSPGALWRLARRGGAPLLALSLVAVLQNEDVILVRHGMTHAAAGLYAEAAVAARGILWFGVGLGLFLLPEAARRARAGSDPRGVLAQMIALVCALAVPLIAVFSLAGVPLLRAVFHTHRGFAATGSALPLLCVAMTLLAISFLAVQYLLALGRTAFAMPLLVAAVCESAAVLLAGASYVRVALAIVVVQALLLAGLLWTALREPAPRVAAKEAVLA
jgi:O-antigen/teichoic acid export membrane protein